jgi:succinate dehydrogenase/fumarate reductase flavoprotein subunit
MRCLDVRNILDLAEVHIQACLDRKETRGSHIRLDYPEEDRSRESRLTFQRLEGRRPVIEIKEIPTLKPEYAKEVK